MKNTSRQLSPISQLTLCKGDDFLSASLVPPSLRAFLSPVLNSQDMDNDSDTLQQEEHVVKEKIVHQQAFVLKLKKEITCQQEKIGRAKKQVETQTLSCTTRQTSKTRPSAVVFMKTRIRFLPLWHKQALAVCVQPSVSILEH